MTLTAFARCNGREAGLDEGFQEKLDRLVEEGTQVVHLGQMYRPKRLPAPAP